MTVTPSLDASPASEAYANEWGSATTLSDEEAANLATVATVATHWNRQDAAAIVEHYEDDIVWRNVAMGEVYTGKAAVRGFLDQLFVALPDLSLDVTFRVPRGGFVAEEYVIRGTHRGPMFGLPATGRAVELPAVSMVEMRHARFAEDHFYFDAASAMRQMGYFPDSTAAYTMPGRAVLGVVSRVIRLGSRRGLRG